MACPITLAIADAALSARLYLPADPNQQFWSQAERLLYLQEAIREWNALAAYWRGDFQFPSQANVAWYDLTTVVGTLRPVTLTPSLLYTIILYHLLEPPTGSVSAQFSATDLSNAVNQRLNELLGTTGCFITHSTIPAAPGRTALAANTLDLRRLAFIPAMGFGSPSTLWEDDSWAWQAFEPNYTTMPPGIPSTYARSTQPVQTFDVDTNLNVPGTYELLTIENSLASPTSTIIPDDWAWVLKWGALAELLGRESNAKDPLRQQYCERRYAEGMSLLALAPALLGMRVNNVPIEVDAVVSSDQYNTGWESTTPTAPTAALVAGLNLVALSPTPDSSLYTVSATVVENAPVPSLSADCINVTEDVYEAILDEAQHLAMFKCGGAEFEATLAMHQRFLSLAALYSSRIAEMGEFAQTLYKQSQREAERHPRYTADSPAEVTSGG